MRPVIAVTTTRRVLGPAGTSARLQRPPRPETYLLSDYLRAITAAGGLPLPLAPVDGLHEALAGWAADRVQGVVISGGPIDIAPHWYGAQQRVPFPSVDEGRTELEAALVRHCLQRDIPLLGVCNGMQLLAALTGGDLYQDLEHELPGASEHQQPTPPSQTWHEVELEGGAVRSAYGRARIQVNSTHRQAVRDPGALRITGLAPDGVAEAIELPGHRFCVGVQWHPEALGGELYPQLVAAAGGSG